MSKAEPPQFNYAAFLAHLEAKQAALEAMIASVKQWVNLGGDAADLPQTLPSGGGKEGDIKEAHVSPGSFLGLSQADAVKKYLNNVKRAVGTKEILEALKKGGYDTSYKALHTGLMRREKVIGDISRQSRKWVLSAWYPNSKKGK